MTRTFAADLSRFADLTEEKLGRVVRQSAQEVVGIAQTTVAQGGSMPVDTGFLRNTLVSELNGSTIAGGGDAYGLAIAGMKPGDVLRVGWTAAYARARHYTPESFGQGGGMWRDKAAAQWGAIVAKNAGLVR